MLRTALACATVPSSNLERSSRFYEETLGMTGTRLGLEGGLYYEAGGGSLLHLYEAAAPASEHAVATFIVEDLDEVMAGLRSRGLSFEEDDVAAQESDFRGARFKDPDGNIIALRSY